MSIYNPATQECVELPEFGFDGSSKQYKVMQLFYAHLNQHSYRGSSTHPSSSWRRLENVPKFECSPDSSSSALVNGIMHWFTPGIMQILLFDLVSETFGIIAFPLNIWWLTRHEFKLINLSGSLTIVGLNSCYNYLKVSIMRDYNNHQHGSWTELIIDLNLCPFPKYDEYDILPICMWKNNEILLHCKSRVLVSYNFDSRQYNRHNVSDCYHLQKLPPWCNIEVYPYVGNLISLKSVCKEQQNAIPSTNSVCNEETNARKKIKR